MHATIRLKFVFRFARTTISPNWKNKQLIRKWVLTNPWLICFKIPARKLHSLRQSRHNEKPLTQKVFIQKKQATLSTTAISTERSTHKQQRRRSTHTHEKALPSRRSTNPHQLNLITTKTHVLRSKTLISDILNKSPLTRQHNTP